MSREAAQHVEMNNPDQNVHQEDEQKQEICLFSIWQDSPATAEAGGRHLIVDDGLRPLLNSDCVHPLGPTEHEESCLTVVPPGQQRPHHGPKAEQVSPGAVNLTTFGWVSPNMDFSFRGHSLTKLPKPSSAAERLLVQLDGPRNFGQLHGHPATTCEGILS